MVLTRNEAILERGQRFSRRMRLWIFTLLAVESFPSWIKWDSSLITEILLSRFVQRIRYIERNNFLFTSATSRYKQQRKNCAKLRQLGFRCTRLIYSSRHKSPFWTKFTENVILWYFCATQCHKIDSFERQLASIECVLKSIHLNSHTFVTFPPQVWGNL